MFNIYESLVGKTETRMIAEYSMWSTINYLMTIAMSYFVEAIPTKHHSKKHEL